jgi:hypothetical protein
MLDWFGVLVGEFGKEVAAVLGLLYGTYKFKRVKSFAGTIVDGIGFAATTGAVIVGSVFMGSSLGWVSIDVGQAVSDIIGGGQAVWSLIGDHVLDALAGAA